MTSPVQIPYQKPALDLSQQVALLRSRGMVIADEPRARHYLAFVNYYRLAAYWLPFEADHASHLFQTGTTFEMVLGRYVFDRELRLLLIDAIERVEVAIRTQFAHQLGHLYGPHAMLDPKRFRASSKTWNYSDQCLQLRQQAAASREEFMRHLLAKYQEPLPPIWAAVEIMSLGQLSKWYANLAASGDRNLIARQMDFDEVNLASFLHHLAVVRNLCAHHSRVWNREFTFTFKLPRHRPRAVRGCLNSAAPGKLYNTLTLLVAILEIISPGSQWKQRLVALLQQHAIPEQDMGFPMNWQALPLWK